MKKYYFISYTKESSYNSTYDLETISEDHPIKWLIDKRNKGEVVHIDFWAEVPEEILKEVKNYFNIR